MIEQIDNLEEKQLEEFKITDNLGSGYSADTMLGSDCLTGKLTAIKILNDKGKKTLVESQMMEVKALQKLNHDNIVKFIKFDQDCEYLKINNGIISERL